ncbi:MAG: hypothetical protein AB7H66_00375 [Hyphomonadaceae bacterium]
MSGRILSLVTLVLGLITLGAFVWLGVAPEVTSVYERSEVALAVSEFQRSITTADLARVFGDPADPAIVAAQDSINSRDLWAFIPAYTLFLIAAALMLSEMRGLITWAAILFAVLGGAADAVETYLQLCVTGDFANAERYLPIATWHWAKYLALAFNGLAAAALCLLAARKRWIIGVIALAPLPLVLLAWAGVTSPRLFSAAFAAYWIGLLVLAAIETVRGRGAQA